MKMDRQPAVSVIIPVFNREATIVRAIESVRAQSIVDFEIMVIDDGSSDQTVRVVQALGDPRIRILEHETNRGAAAARNTGMRAARGQYIAWLDSDDEWLPGKLESQLKQLMEAPELARASCTAYEVCTPKERYDYYPRAVDRRKLLLGCDLGPGSTLCFEHSVLEKIGYLDEQLPRYEDWDWLLRYCQNYELREIATPLARVYSDPGRPTSNLEVSASHFVAKYGTELGQMGWYGRKALGRRWMDVACSYAREHRLSKMTRYLLKATFANPFQRPGTWLMIFDAWFGSQIGVRLSKMKTRWLVGQADSERNR